MSQPKTQTVDAKFYDKFGRGSDSLGAAYQDETYRQANTLDPIIKEYSQRATTSLRNASNNPNFTMAGNLATGQLRGDYLSGSPELQRGLDSIRTEAIRGAQNQGADVRSQFNRTGMGFSTANQQAQQNSRVLAEANANRDIGKILANNYAMERQIQQQSLPLLTQALTTPAQLNLQAAEAAQLPVTNRVNLSSALATGQSVQNPTLLQKPGTFDTVAKYLSPVSMLAGGLF